MNVTLLNTYDSSGGAAKASFRLHQSLRQAEINSSILVQSKTSDDPYVKEKPKSFWERRLSNLNTLMDQLPVKCYSSRLPQTFSPAWWPTNINHQITEIQPDIVHLQWICDGFIRLESLSKIKQSIVWTLHDMWPFTGGCHYSGDCNGYINGCGSCPQLDSNKENDLSSKVVKRKKKIFKGLNLYIVTPSRWLTSCAKASFLFKNLPVETIPYCLNLDRYSPVNPIYARKVLGLPENKKLILFGAMSATSDPRKGFHLLRQSIQYLTENNSVDAEIVILGSSKPTSPPDFRLKTHYMGVLHDDISISLLYGACDVFVAPSLEDNLPLTVMESLSCGTPCVTFDIGGMPDMIDHKENGFLAKPFDTKEFAMGIEWVLEDEKRHKALSCEARRKIELNYSNELISNKYKSLYEDILKKQT
ncbi:glycosyltransferase family 4 protein [Thermodesulfobacteriota bacterium]